MLVFVLSFIIIALYRLALSLSLLYGRGAIKGSCRAMDNLPGFYAGDDCSGACGPKQNHPLATAAIAVLVQISVRQMLNGSARN